MVFDPPERFNIADYFLGARLAEGNGARPALLTDQGTYTYAEVDRLASRFAHLLREAQVSPEQRVIIALPDGPAFVGALFGILKIGAVVVMVNPQVPIEQIAYFYDYTRATAALVAGPTADAFLDGARGARSLKAVLRVDGPEVALRLDALPDVIERYPTHRDDPAIWLFSGGTTGQPKAVVQTHRSYANTTECYAKGVLGYGADDITISVPKLFFGYAMGANLFFPFSVGARAILFEEPSTPEALFTRIAKHRPTVLINVPTMVNRMVSHPEASTQDLSSLRFATSAGEALPVELYHRWKDTFGVELLDGLGTAEMWHIFLTNRIGAVKPGTLGQVVAGFEVKAADDTGTEVPLGEVGLLWVRGNSQGLGYWQLQEKTRASFRGDWVVCGDLVSRDADGYFTHHGRADEMLKVSGKWLSPQEVESCLLQHPAVREAAVVGITGEGGLVKPHAYVVTLDRYDSLAEELKAFVRDRLEPYKAPREVSFVDALPRTHLGKVDRGKLRKGASR
ncbi:MAG TPA: benzoate-CoA ligase family protein [Gemmatimonadales bacterium]|nr:benzoate-CoA ligase family protein [Gemmatimonadales bacterium]